MEIFIDLVCFAVVNITLIVLGYLVIQRKLVKAAWLLLVVSILTVTFIFLHDSPILKMLAIIATTFTAMKVIAVTESYNHKPLTLSFRQWVAFSGWAGMRAQPFETLGGQALLNAWSMVKFGVSRVIAGFALILLTHFIVGLALSDTLRHILVSCILLIGFSLILHFGMLSISAGMWRRSGVGTYYLFKQPATALSLSEFWSKRWNIAFSEMTSIAIFRPLRNSVGPAAALMLAFAFSGLLHELALSLPVNSGYGLPLLYFIIQGSMVLIEKLMITNGITLLRNRLAARLWVFLWLIIPAPLLFHHEFIKQIVWPLAGLKY